MAVGNGLRGDVWKEFIKKFGDIHIYEFYAATEGNIGFMNYTRKIGAVGRVNYLQRVSTKALSVKGTRCPNKEISEKSCHDSIMNRNSCNIRAEVQPSHLYEFAYSLTVL